MKRGTLRADSAAEELGKKIQGKNKGARIHLPVTHLPVILWAVGDSECCCWVLAEWLA
ncbi:hypothetical protein [Roseimaritima ulvae]|uniref:Uncharacterized protein n=1 Tax=Roseimaritima ulvae TaxID=980254 RepID=A0A5B9QZY1_9BACT|nr:hypothetical protein [Roseimaritima ulvae]QEG39561.1 hypothetical protein UC8_15560 [Roseimaritima ulvae]